jgi:predicted transglutaminase-like cysteine proteinase
MIRPAILAPADLQVVLDRVNARMRYQSEPGGQDYWQTPAESYALGTGDCEDFAIAYWHELQAPGAVPSYLPGARLAWLLPDAQPPVPHVVCFVGDRADPWVLDVLADAPYRLSERHDLVHFWSIGDPPERSRGVADFMRQKIADMQARMAG